MDRGIGFGLMVAVVERRMKEIPADIPESSRMTWALMPFRDVINDLLDELEKC